MGEQGKRKDHTGKRFGRLAVVRHSHDQINVGRVGKDKTRKRVQVMWECLCDCGNTTVVRANSLVIGHAKSCGCLAREIQRTNGKKNRTHGMTDTKEFRAWSSMKARCCSPTNHNYHRYGARGIRVCDRRLESFENFLADMGKCPDKTLSLNRIDNNGHYEPGNCKWSTMDEQANNKRTSRLLTFGGKTQTMSQWAREMGMLYVTLQRRLGAYGWSVERALTTPVKKNKRSRKRGSKSGPAS